MNIHDPKAHTAALGVMFAGLLGVGGWTALQPTPPPPHVGYSISSQALDAIPFGKHAYQIFAAPESGDMPEDMVEAIKREGGSAAIDSDLLTHEGIWVSPDTPEGRAVANTIGMAIGEPVKVGNADGGAFEIGIGHPAHKGAAK